MEKKLLRMVMRYIHTFLVRFLCWIRRERFMDCVEFQPISPKRRMREIGLKKSDKSFSICLISCQSVSICKQVTTVFPMPIKCFAIGLETLKLKNVIRQCTTEKYPVTRAPLLELLIPKKQNQIYGIPQMGKPICQL